MKNKKNLLRVTNLKNEKINSWFRSLSRFLYWNGTLRNSDFFENSAVIFDFAILDTDLALNKYGLWSCDNSAHALPNAIVFFEKVFCY